jgi:hypothetical protein
MTLMIPQGSLDIQRYMNQQSLPHAALLLLKRVDPSARGDGGARTERWLTVDEADAVPCRLTAAGDTAPEEPIADRLANVDRYVVAFDLGTDLPEGSRLKISGVTRGAPWSVLLDVRGRETPVGDAHEVMARYLAEPVPAGADGSESA